MSIAHSALLVDHSISVWSARKKDKEATETLLAQNNASRDAASVSKNLMAGTSLRKDISDYAAKCRARHTEMTIPWNDRGSRALPTSLFLDYKQEFDARKTYFHKLVTEFVSTYPTLRMQAANYHQALGNLYDPDDYPSVYEVREKFGYRVVFSPIAESGDFRLDVPQQQLEEVKAGYEEKFNSRLAEAMREPWNRLHEMVVTLSEKVSSESSRYTESSFENAIAMCSMLTHLNVTKDPELEKARRQLERVLSSGASWEGLKEDPHTRAEMKSDLDKILKQYDW